VEVLLFIWRGVLIDLIFKFTLDLIWFITTLLLPPQGFLFIYTSPNASKQHPIPGTINHLRRSF
jgi:hypothetical protein